MTMTSIYLTDPTLAISPSSSTTLGTTFAHLATVSLLAFLGKVWIEYALALTVFFLILQPGKLHLMRYDPFIPLAMIIGDRPEIN